MQNSHLKFNISFKFLGISIIPCYLCGPDDVIQNGRLNHAKSHSKHFKYLAITPTSGDEYNREVFASQWEQLKWMTPHST